MRSLLAAALLLPACAICAVALAIGAVGLGVGCVAVAVAPRPRGIEDSFDVRLGVVR